MKRFALIIIALTLSVSIIALVVMTVIPQLFDREDQRTSWSPQESPIRPYFYQEIGTKQVMEETNPSKIPIRQFTLEIAAMPSRPEAESLVKQLQQKGIDAFYTPLNRQGHVVFRVRYGIFQKEDMAQKEAAVLQNQHGLKVQVKTF